MHKIESLKCNNNTNQICSLHTEKSVKMVSGSKVPGNRRSIVDIIEVRILHVLNNEQTSIYTGPLGQHRYKFAPTRFDFRLIVFYSLSTTIDLRRTFAILRFNLWEISFVVTTIFSEKSHLFQLCQSSFLLDAVNDLRLSRNFRKNYFACLCPGTMAIGGQSGLVHRNRLVIIFACSFLLSWPCSLEGAKNGLLWPF